MALKRNKFAGGVEAESNGIQLKDNGGVELYEASASGTSKITLKAPAALSADETYILPTADGSGGQVLSTDGSGQLSFVNNGGTRTVNSYSSDQTLTTANDIVLVDPSSSTITITLPAVSGNTGLLYTIKQITDSTNNVIIDGNGSETINGATTYTLDIANAFIDIFCDGSSWHIINKGEPEISVFGYRSSDQAGASGTQRITFNAEDTDTVGCFNDSTGVTTVPSSGRYYIEATGLLDSLDTSADATIGIYLEGSLVINSYMYVRSTSITDQQYGRAAGIIECDKGEEIDVRVIGDAGYAIVGNPDRRTCFTLFKLKDY